MSSIKLNNRFLKVVISAGAICMLQSCSFRNESDLHVSEYRRVEYYKPNVRRLGPEPVYGKLTWSHLPQPISAPTVENTQYIQPVVTFEMPHATLQEAVEALAQTMGYRWAFDKALGSRPVSLRMEGTVDEVLSEISKQASVDAEFDRKERLVRVYDRQMAPRLPEN